MPTPCSKCKNKEICYEPCDSFKKWKENPEQVMADIEKTITLYISRSDVCMQDCEDLSITLRVEPGKKMSEIDDELRKKWLPKGYNWIGGCKTGTAADYCKGSSTAFLSYRKV